MPAALLHQYTFNSNSATDSIGGSQWAGSLANSATIEGGQLTFPSTTAHLQLPAGILGSALSSVSIEMWITTSTIGNSADGLRIFQFGSLSAENFNPGSLTFNRHNINGGFLYERFDFNGIVVESTGTTIATPFSGQTNLHVVLVIADGGRTKVYFNGALMATSAGSGNLIPTGTAGEINTIGSKSYMGFVGSVDEFRIWSGSLSLADVRLHYHAGVDGLYTAGLAAAVSADTNGISRT